MANVTLRILDGGDRGKGFEGLTTPITIGREEGNTIQLNDDRVSRFHVKIQEDHDKLVLTDLESTNGTCVNGETVQLRILRFGDVITVGKSLILYGSRDEIAGRLAALRDIDLEEAGTIDAEAAEQLAGAVSLDFELNISEDNSLASTMHSLEPPELPERLDTVQSAQLSELIEFLHRRLRNLFASATLDEEANQAKLDFRQWQGLLDLQDRLSKYLRQIGNPDE